MSFDIKFIRLDQKHIILAQQISPFLHCFWSHLINLISKDSNMVFSFSLLRDLAFGKQNVGSEIANMVVLSKSWWNLSFFLFHRRKNMCLPPIIIQSDHWKFQIYNRFIGVDGSLFHADRLLKTCNQNIRPGLDYYLEQTLMSACTTG